MKKVALAKIPLKKLSQAALITYAQKHAAAILVAPGLTNFPDIPNDSATITALTNSYITTLAAAYKGSKLQTQAKDEAKEHLIYALRQNFVYVNQDISTSSGNFGTYEQQKAFMQTSGFTVNDNSKKAGALKAPIIRSLTSPEIGTMKILLNAFSKSGKQRTSKVRGSKTYTLNYQTAANGATPAGPWIQSVQSSYIISLTGLASGTYNVYVEANGASNQKAPTNTRTVTVL